MNIEWLIVVVTLVITFVFVTITLVTEKDAPSYIAFGFLVLLFFLLLNAGVVSVARRSCRVLAEINEWNYSYSYTNKCLLEVEPGRWIPKGAIYSQVEDLPGS